MSANPAFKRSDFPTPKLRFYFFLFALLSLAPLYLLLSEEFRLSLHEIHTQEINSLFLQLNSALNTFTSPLGMVVLSLWISCSLLFAWVFKHRIWAIFQLFFTLSFLSLLLFNFWTHFICAAIQDPHSKLIFFSKHTQYPYELKVAFLLLWASFGIYFCFSMMKVKYLGILHRLQRLFTSIARGNWDSLLFFRTNDPFSFLAKSFNTLKDGYLDKIHKQDECLVLLKDALISDTNNPYLKEKLQTLIRQYKDSKIA